jgi:hypothetical protein
MKVTRVAGNVYMLEGAGGNIGASVGDDGIVIVDDQYAPLAEKIQAALKGITDKPVPSSSTLTITATTQAETPTSRNKLRSSPTTMFANAWRAAGGWETAAQYTWTPSLPFAKHCPSSPLIMTSPCI